MIYFEDFKLFKSEDDTGYIMMNVNGTPEVDCWLNDTHKCIVESDGYCSCNVYIDVEELNQGNNTLKIIDLYGGETIVQYLEVIENDKNTISKMW